jgi:hypothetical protein
MAATWGGFHLQARDADYSPIELSDQEVCVGRALCEALPPLFNRAKGELERSGDDTRAVPNLRDGLDVSWLGCTDLNGGHGERLLSRGILTLSPAIKVLSTTGQPYCDELAGTFW